MGRDRQIRQALEPLGGLQIVRIAKQIAVLTFDRLVTLARSFAEALDIEYFDFAAVVSDHAGFLQSASDSGHAGASDAEHVSQKLLREW